MLFLLLDKEMTPIKSMTLHLLSPSLLFLLLIPDDGMGTVQSLTVSSCIKFWSLVSLFGVTLSFLIWKKLPS